MHEMEKPESMKSPSMRDDDCGDSPGCCGPVDRRTFLRWAGAGAAALAAVRATRPAVAGPFSVRDPDDHFVPADKQLTDAWLKTLYARGGSTWYEATDLETIGMPIGGLCTGQLYLAGDGRLVNWDIFNEHIFTGYGRDNYQLGRVPPSPLAQGFALRITSGDQPRERTLDVDGFPALRFCGEYPVGRVDYRDDAFPLDVELRAYSPFIPLNEEDSALPATVMQFSLKNRSDRPVEATLAGWLENAVCRNSGQTLNGMHRNQVVRRDGMTMVLGSAHAAEATRPSREPIVLADFEGGDYGNWRVEGDAFGERPAAGTLDRQQPVSGFRGRGLVNTYLGGDDRLLGRLTSPEFTIERDFLSFLIGGGSHAGKTCMNLRVGDKIVRTAVGKNREQLTWHNWNLREFQGKRARLEIVDQETRGWGHINIDQIELRDQPVADVQGPLEDQVDFGTMGLAILDDAGDVQSCAGLPAGAPGDVVFSESQQAATTDVERPFGERLCGAIAKPLSLDPGQETVVTFLVAWCFPQRETRGGRRGNYYARRFDDAADVASYLSQDFQRLDGETRRWHETWYESSLPHWLLDRLFSTTSTLATSTCQWWDDGRFWAWEGVGCCHGTCTHVWNYEHTMARLFPRLERSVRELQDYNPEAGFVEETGMIRFRGEDWAGWAGDGQAGSVLKAYREHQLSVDASFLSRNWPRIRKSLEFLINEDNDNNGLLEGSQHNTYDINFFGPNTMIGSLYLAALQAGAAMADEIGDADFALECRELFRVGSAAGVERLFNGEYFIQEVDLQQHPKHQVGDGCLADQLFGQGWSHQVGLGYVYPPAEVRKTLESIWRYNWAPDIGPQNAAHEPERWFARPGEAGLFTCTWPKSKHLPEGVRYKNEIWTGIEYQVAGNMAWEGMVTESLAICRGVHERYHPAKHNPWNEIECGDHYARGMASHGVFLGLCGFEYHGPRGYLGFAPRINPESFQAAFTAAQGWGSLSQQREAGRQTQRIEVRWGTLRLESLAFEVPEDATLKAVEVDIDGESCSATPSQEDRRVLLQLDPPVRVEQGAVLTADLRW